MEVGIRELKSKLSAYVGHAASGADVVVTDHGRPVARLVPFHAGNDVERGIAEGWIEGPRRHGLDPVEPISVDLPTVDVLTEDRG